METKQKLKNECAKMRKVDNPYEIWKTPNGSWEWRVLKKWQVDDDKPYARWFCAVKSPFTYGRFEYGDVYVQEIKAVAERVISVEEFEDFDNKKGKFEEEEILGCGKFDKENPDLIRCCGDVLFSNKIWLCKDCRKKSYTPEQKKIIDRGDEL